MVNDCCRVGDWVTGKPTFATGSFRSIGQFATQNMKMMQSPYQRFTFAPSSLRAFPIFGFGGGTRFTARFTDRFGGAIKPATIVQPKL